MSNRGNCEQFDCGWNAKLPENSPTTDHIRATTLFLDYWVCTMTAHVVKSADDVVAPPNQKERKPGDFERPIISHIRETNSVANEQPALSAGGIKLSYFPRTITRIAHFGEDGSPFNVVHLGRHPPGSG